MSQLRWCLELLCYFHLGLWFMHSLLCLFGSVWLGKKNSWHFQWTHRCSIIQRPQKANSDLNTHNNSILLELTLFYCLAKFGVGVGRCSYSYRLCRERKGVCDKLQRGIRWKKQKIHTTTTKHRYEIYSEWQKKNWTLDIAGAQTFGSCLWSNCQNPIRLDIDWELVLSNHTLNNFAMQEKTDPSYLVSFVKAGSAICFLD